MFNNRCYYRINVVDGMLFSPEFIDGIGDMFVKYPAVDSIEFNIVSPTFSLVESEKPDNKYTVNIEVDPFGTIEEKITEVSTKLMESLKTKYQVH